MSDKSSTGRRVVVELTQARQARRRRAVLRARRSAPHRPSRSRRRAARAISSSRARVAAGLAWSASSARQTASRRCSRRFSTSGASTAPTSHTTRRPRASKAARTCASCRRSPSTRRRRRTTTTRSRSPARATACARTSTSRTCRTSSPAGTPLDRGAADRSCSVYVPGRVAPMLPSELADDQCSLRPDQERLTVTVEIPFGDGLTMGTPSFYRSVIRSDARLTYGHAERALAGTEQLDGEVGETLRLAEQLAEELRRRRFARGRSTDRSRRGRRSPSTARAASPTPGSSASRMRTCSSRS